LNLKCDILVSKFASKFNVYRYNEVVERTSYPCWKNRHPTTPPGRGGAVQVECS
jgi:hypothetical protein